MPEPTLKEQIEALFGRIKTDVLRATPNFHTEDMKVAFDLTKKERRALAVKVGEKEQIEALKVGHYYCEDSWYSCPKADGGCADDAQGDECNCGADRRDSQIDALAARVGKLKDAAYDLAMLALQSERYESDDDFNAATDKCLELTRDVLRRRLVGEAK